MTVAFWRTLYSPGHDVARLDRVDDGWRLSGTALWIQDGRPARLDYAVALTSGWITRAGRITGFIGEDPVDRRITLTDGRWALDGVEQPELDRLIHLDFGFTPATNLQQLKHADLAIGEAADIHAAWIDYEGGLSRLPQRYRRTGKETYAYESPTSGYAETLIVAPDGFAREYPTLWTRLL
ncbi:putative glycolipid-binding domain-containing protein [Brevundimonas sp. NPDC092305]|uniref:putative glycolipid-binding domain-containing protein n=1 Tax=Brevundimonas sp. NPDC092305 TaxID=3363957 RepID=UPI0038302A69